MYDMRVFSGPCAKRLSEVLCMTSPDDEDVTRLLNDFSRGDPEAFDRIIPIVYQELRQIAERHMCRERADHTLQPTALISEIYLRLFNKKIEYSDREHFLATASRLMRRLLVDHYRRIHADRRQGRLIKIPLEEAIECPAAPRCDLVALNDALSDFEGLSPRASKIVEMRFFGGFQLNEIADALGVSLATVKRDWSFAQVWLYSQLSERSEDFGASRHLHTAGDLSDS